MSRQYQNVNFKHDDGLYIRQTCVLKHCVLTSKTSHVTSKQKPLNESRGVEGGSIVFIELRQRFEELIYFSAFTGVIPFL